MMKTTVSCSRPMATAGHETLSLSFHCLPRCFHCVVSSTLVSQMLQRLSGQANGALCAASASGRGNQRDEYSVLSFLLHFSQE